MALFNKLHNALLSESFEDYVWTEIKKGIISKFCIKEEDIEEGEGFVKWCLDTFEEQPIYFWIFMNNQYDGNTVGIGFDSEEDNELQKDRTLRATEQMKDKIAGKNSDFQQVSCDQRDGNTLADYGWIAAYSINAKLNFGDFNNETLYNTEQRQIFIDGLLEDIRIIIDHYKKS